MYRLISKIIYYLFGRLKYYLYLCIEIIINLKKGFIMNTTRQYDLQQEIYNVTGMNLVTCGNCGSTIIQEKDQIAILCSDCGFISEPADFPDLNNIYDELKHPLATFVNKQELILEDIFLFDDKEEKDPNDVLCNSDADDFPIIFGVSKDNERVRIWKLSEPQSVIEKKYRYEILKSRLGKVTADDEVSLGDIFMYGKFNKELTMTEYLKLIEKDLLGEK